MTETTKWSTTGFPLQHQSPINQTSDQNYGNHPLEDVDLMYVYQQIRFFSELWCPQKWTVKMVKDTMYVKIYLLPWMAEKNLNSSLPFRQSAVKFPLPWASFSLCIFLFSWRTTCLGLWTLGKWEWKVTCSVEKSTCSSGQLEKARVSSSAVVIKRENIEIIYDFTPL